MISACPQCGVYEHIRAAPGPPPAAVQGGDACIDMPVIGAGGFNHKPASVGRGETAKEVERRRGGRKERGPGRAKQSQNTSSFFPPRTSPFQPNACNPVYVSHLRLRTVPFAPTASPLPSWPRRAVTLRRGLRTREGRRAVSGRLSRRALQGRGGRPPRWSLPPLQRVEVAPSHSCTHKRTRTEVHFAIFFLIFFFKLGIPMLELPTGTRRFVSDCYAAHVEYLFLN